MNCTDCTTRLNAYVDRELAAADARAIEGHVAGCAACRAELASLQSLLTQARALPRDIPPAPHGWRELRSEVERLEPKPLGSGSASLPSAEREVYPPTAAPKATRAVPLRIETHSTSLAPILRWLVPLAAAAAILLLAAVVGRHPLPREGTSPAWSVAALAGAPRVNTRIISDPTAFRLGQWLETDAASRAKVVVGTIGDVTVEPSSRLRLTGVADANHRLELQRGSLRAFIYAPPRLFFVDTPSATAVDLGCAYTLTVADNGDGELHVTLGYVALEHGDREALIPARAMCLTRKGTGPGTPFVEDAPAGLRDALARFDFTPGAAPTALPEVLRQARADDAITLWNLLSRTEAAARAAVFDRLSDLRSVPATVTRAGILAGNESMRRAWATDLGFETFGLR